MHIRFASPGDIPWLMALEKDAATAAHWSRDQYQCAFSGSGPKRTVLVIEEHGAIQGFLMARLVGQDWEIENLAIAELARRRGLGLRLLGNFLKLAGQQAGGNVFLEVRTTNGAARALFEQCGFTECGRRRNYYGHPQDDAVIYVLRFG
jgi:[ribosomal protein S18]-alanine N-acetyltransferase